MTGPRACRIVQHTGLVETNHRRIKGDGIVVIVEDPAQFVARAPLFQPGAGTVGIDRR